MLTVSSVIRRKKNIESINLGKHEYQARVLIRDATDYFDEIELTKYMPQYIQKLFFEYDSIVFEKFKVAVSEHLEVYIYFSKKELLSSKEKKELNDQIRTSFYVLSEYIEIVHLKGKIEQIESKLTEKLAKISNYERRLSEVVVKQELESYGSKIIEQIDSNVSDKMTRYEEQFTDSFTKKYLEKYSSEVENIKGKVEKLKTTLLENKISYKKQVQNFITQQELEISELQFDKTLKKIEAKLMKDIGSYAKQAEKFVTQQELGVHGSRLDSRIEEIEANLTAKKISYEQQMKMFVTQQELGVHGSRLDSRIKEIEANLVAKKISYEQQMELFVTKQELVSYQSNINSKLEGKIGELEIKLIDELKRFQSQLVENIKSDLSSVEQTEKSNALKETAEKYEQQLLSEKSKYMEEIIQTNAIDIQNKVQQIYDLFTSEKKVIKFKMRKTFIKYSQARLYSNQLNYCFFYWQYLKQYNLLVISMFTIEKEKLKYLKRKLEALPLFIDQYDQKFVNRAFFKLPLSEKKEIMAYIELKELLETYYTMITK